jgi:hypothetical protein
MNQSSVAFHLLLLLVIASTLIFTAVKFSSTCHLYLQFYMSAVYILSCQESGSLRIPTIYSLTYNCSMQYVRTVYSRHGIADHALNDVAHVTTAA